MSTLIHSCCFKSQQHALGQFWIGRVGQYSSGADTRRIKGAQWAAYIEKSLKDVAFNAAQDDFSALDKLPAGSQDKPVVFSCNGAECWKSYKAAKVAASKGYKKVYWLRGGLPEWAADGLPTEGG